MVEVGLIGTGTIAEFHAEAIRDLPGARLRSVFDTQEPRAMEFARKWNARAYGRLSDFLADPELHCVSICTPSGAHRDTAIAAADAGKHVLIEKPIEVTTERAEEIVAACERAGVQLGGVFQTRYHPASTIVHEAINAGWFGRVSLVSAEIKWFRDADYYAGSRWRGTWRLDGGGALMNQSIHSVDLLLWYFGFPVEIAAQASIRTHDGIEVEDTLVAALRFPGGELGTIQATTGAWPGSFKTIEVCGEAGHVRLEEDRIRRWEFSPDSAAPSMEAVLDRLGDSDVSDPLQIGSGAHRRQYADFLATLSGDAIPRVTARDAVEAVRLVEGIYRAADIGPGRSVHGYIPPTT